MPACGGEQQPHMTLPSYIQKSFAWNWYKSSYASSLFNVMVLLLSLRGKR